FVDEARLLGWNNLVLEALEQDQWRPDAIGERNRRTRATDGLPVVRSRPKQTMQIAGLELVRMLHQQRQVRNAIVRRARLEETRGCKPHQDSVAASAAARDGDARRIGKAVQTEIESRRLAIADVGDAPAAVEP